MPNRILAVDPHGHQLVAILIESSFRSYELVAHHCVPRESDTSLGEQLRRLVEEQDLHADTVVSVLPGTDVAFRLLDLPFRDRRRLQQTVPFELEGHLPIAIEDGVIDFQVLGRTGEGARVFAALAPRERIEEHLRVLAEAGLDPAVVDFGALTALNVVHLFDGERPEQYAFLHLDQGRGSLALFRGRELEALRFIDIGVHPSAEAFLQEVHWSLLSFDGRRPEDPESLPLLLGGNGPAELPDLLRDRLRLEVQHLEELPLRNIPEAVRTQQGLYAPALGVALRQISDDASLGLNFRQGQFAYHRSQREIQSRLLRLGSLAAAVLALFLIGEGTAYYRLSAQAQELDRRIRSVFQETLPEERTIVDEVTQLRQAIDRLRERQAQLGVPTSGSVSFLQAFRELSAAAPSDPRMEVEELDADTGAIRLKAETPSFEAVDAIKQSIATSPVLHDVQVKDPRTTADGAVSFRLNVFFGRDEVEP